MPLTVLDLGPEHEAAVLEMGMYTGGEIRDLAAIGRPSIGIVTAVQPVHLSRIGSIDAIEDAKAELVEALPAAADGGVAILNADDPRVLRMASRTRAREHLRVRPDADVRATNVTSLGPRGDDVRAGDAGGDATSDPRARRLAVHNALAARGRARRRHDPEEIVAGLAPLSSADIAASSARAA